MDITEIGCEDADWLRIDHAPGSYEPVIKFWIAQMARNLMSSEACAPWNQ
jgi:hypothetical protein